MANYQKQLLEYLANYKALELGIDVPGIYQHKGRDLERGHILPDDRKLLNFFPEIREDAQKVKNYQGKSIQWHHYFHHLNSSQVFAFNLFYPLFQSSFGVKCLAEIVGFETIQPEMSSFELIPDPEEGTNIDVAIGGPGRDRVYIEVKLSEDDFGRAANDKSHREKFEEIYRPRMQGKVRIKGEDEWTEFRRNYQFYRNVIFADGDTRVWFLIPGRHRSLIRRAERCMKNLDEAIRNRVELVQAEQLFEKIENAVKDDPELSSYFKRFRIKYAPALESVTETGP